MKVKERELAIALMRVAELTRQLDQLHRGQLDGVLVDSTSTHAKLLDRNPEVSLNFSVFICIFCFFFSKNMFLTAILFVCAV